MAKRIKDDRTNINGIRFVNCLNLPVVLNGTVYEPSGHNSFITEHREYRSVNGHTFLITHAQHYLPDKEPGVFLIVSQRTRIALSQERDDLVVLYENDGKDRHGRLIAQGVQMHVPYIAPEDE